MPLHKRIYWSLLYLLKPVNGEMIFYRYGEKKKIYGVLSRIMHEKRVLAMFSELYELYVIVERTRKVPGVLAEVGVSQGGSAKVICEVKGDSPLYLFDTFSGLPAPGTHDDLNTKFSDERFYAGQFACSEDRVRAYLQQYTNVHYIAGVFPASVQGVRNLPDAFSFVHLDMDLYEGTKQALEWFYPRMHVGGVILVHDYFQVKGVRKAVDEFFHAKPEVVMLGNCTNGMVVKL